MNAVILTKEEVTLLLACANTFRKGLLKDLGNSEIPNEYRDLCEQNIAVLASARRKLGIMEEVR